MVFVGASRGDALACLAVRVVDDAPEAGLLRDGVLCLRVRIQRRGVRRSIRLTPLYVLIRHIRKAALTYGRSSVSRCRRGVALLYVHVLLALLE